MSVAILKFAAAAMSVGAETVAHPVASVGSSSVAAVAVAVVVVAWS